MPEEIKPEIIQKTQKSLGKYVKKPQLTEKLLKKPPFRFLHDIINTVIKETGFLKGLFTDEELNSDNVKEKDAKVSFLTKLIEAVKNITSTDLAVRPSKIVAGLEPTETNLLLQAIAKAIDKKIDSSEYVKLYHSGEIDNKPKKSKKNENTEKPKKIKTSPHEEKAAKSKEKIINTPTSTDRGKTKKPKEEKPKNKTKTEPEIKEDLKKPKPEKSKRDVTGTEIKDDSRKSKGEKVKKEVVVPEVSQINEELKKPKEVLELDPIQIKEDSIQSTKEVISPIISEANEPEIRKRTPSASRPKSARPRSGDLRAPQEESQPVFIESRPKTSLRPPSVRPSSARPGAPRLRPDSALPIKEVVPMGKINVIVESFDKDDEDETVIIQNNQEDVENQEEVEIPTENKGRLVEDILEQINENDVKNAENVEWQKDIFYGKDATTKDTNNLRSLIQSLTKTANPLGKLLNYLHEDIDAMHAELESWTHTKRQLVEEIGKQKKITAEMNKPLYAQLERLNQEIKKVEDELGNTRHNILKNEIKIKELLLK